MTNTLLKQWLSTYFGAADFTLTPLAGDASFRHYFRAQSAGKSYVAMDASKERDKCPQFVKIAHALRAMGLTTPEIFAENEEQGFLLLTDFGDDVFLKNVTSHTASTWYPLALEALAKLSRCKVVPGYTLPFFTEQFMLDELVLFQEFFLEKYLKLTLSIDTKKMLADAFALIAKKCAQQPQVFMYRDYHSGNLMMLPDRRIGLLDFQDAFIGPITYDLVSLLRDCYIDWPKEQVRQWVLYYHELIQSELTPQAFLAMFDWMGVQRHMKALLTFARKYVRDHNAHYLQFVSRTLNYLLEETESYPELKALRTFLKEVVVMQHEKISKKPTSLKSQVTQRGMILAAGRGARMEHLTQETPKALLRVGGRYLIEYSIHALKTVGIKEIIINVSYLGEQIKAALGDGSRYGIHIAYSEETEALETGGGIFKALPLLGAHPFIVLSADVVTDYPLKNLPKIPEKLAHLVLVDNPPYHPHGDFGLQQNQILMDAAHQFTFGNIGVYRPELFDHCQGGKFRLGDLLKQAIRDAAVTGESYHGFWQNFGTPAQLENRDALPYILP